MGIVSFHLQCSNSLSFSTISNLKTVIASHALIVATRLSSGLWSYRPGGNASNTLFRACTRGCRRPLPSFGRNATSSALSTKCYPKYDRLFPCPSQNGPPRIEHLVMSESGNVVDLICEVLDLPPLYVADLIHFGAVHYALVCPPPPPSATAEQVQLFKEVTSPAVLKKRLSLKGKTVREAQKTFRITSVSQCVEAGTYLRVHVHPKRFPRCYEIDWLSRVIAETESYVVLDKPAGTSEKQVEKEYLALTAASVPLGKISHYMRPISVAPQIVSRDMFRGWHLCQLEVLECKEVPWPNPAVEARYCIQDCGWPTKHVAYECKVKLLTGRTHQIRVQLAAIGAPVVGDSMYIPAAIKRVTLPQLYPFADVDSEKEITIDEDMNAAIDQWILQHGKEPSLAIGLQACQISWNEGEYTYSAGPPWWRLDC